jgi:hypothetical protein
MNRLKTSLILSIGLAILLSACLPITPIPGSSSEAMIQTAIARTQLAEEGRAAAASLYGTGTPEASTADSGETTPEPEDGEEPEIQPTSSNPWMLQAWCEDHNGCAKYEVFNKTDSWLQITLRNTETGDTGFFTIQSKTMGQITLIPGQYQATFTWWCKGDIRSMTEIMPIGLWKDYFKCPQGHYQRIKK